MTLVSVILPILNEEPYLRNAVRSILSQDFQGELEIILAIGPSRDRTQLVAEQLVAEDSRVHIVANPTGRTAAGLNAALSIARGDVVVRVDGHAELPAHYISLGVQLLNETGAVNVGGMMAAEGVTPFEKAVAGAMRSPLGVGASRFHTGGDAGPVDTVYLGIFKRDALTAVGGFDEQFTRAQDWELNHRLSTNGGVIYFDPRLYVTYRPRPSVRALARQYFEYGRWRRVVSRLHSGTINYRYLAPPLAVTGFALSVVSGFIHPIFFIPAAIYVSFTALASIVIAKNLRQWIYLLVVIPTMHFSWGIGFITSPRSLVPVMVAK